VNPAIAGNGEKPDLSGYLRRARPKSLHQSLYNNHSKATGGRSYTNSLSLQKKLYIAASNKFDIPVPVNGSVGRNF